MTKWTFIFMFGGILAAAPGFAQTSPQITAFSPERYTSNSTTATITVQFDRAMSAASFQSQTFTVYGHESGYGSGTINYNEATQTVSFTPDAPFHAGERISVTLTTGIEDAEGNALARAFHWAFYIRTGPGAADFTFDASLPTGDGPNYVEVGELNADGALDVAVPHSVSSDAHTWFNDGAGSLSQNQILGVGAQPRSLTVGDFDRDADLDIAVANEVDNSITILDNNGSGQFTAQSSSLSVGTEPTNIIAGDLNGNGFLDLVTANYEGGTISVLLNQDDGTFAAHVEYEVGADLTSGPQSVAIADFNNDGSPDLAIALDNDEAVALLINDGTGTFQPQQTFSAGGRPHSIVAGDFDLDGLVDVVLGNRVASGTVAVLFNTNGAFAAPVTSPVGDQPIALHAADLNGDTYPDVAVVSRVSNQLHVLINDGAGVLQTEQILSAGDDLRGIRSGDLNGDDALDLVVASWNTDNLFTFFNEAVQNQPPAAPTLVNPQNRLFINPDSTELNLTWNVPDDPENQPLHFVVEFSSTPDFTAIAASFDSRTDNGFTPTPPVDQNTATVVFSVPNSLSDGFYWWRVKAWDGSVFGQNSLARNFIIDTTPPDIASITLTNVDFAPNWYNPDTPATVEVQYDEINAATAEFSLNTVGVIEQLEGIPTGTAQTISPNLDLSELTDGSYRLNVTIADSAGNMTTDGTDLALDGTPPTSTQASSPPLTASLSFTVSWGNTAENGSGVATYDVQVQTDGGAWQPFLTDVTQTSAQFSGEQGREYGFEAIASDNVGNSEEFANSAESVTVVDTTSDDVDAPGPPLSLTASGGNPSPWQNDAEFVIQWQEPSDATGIARTLYKLGSAPTSNFDSTGSVVGTTTVTIEATQENGQNFYLWFVDNAGNVNFANAGAVLLRYDITPPVGATASSRDSSSSENIVVGWGGGTDGNGSGLAGRYDVQYQVDAGTWQNWLVNTDDTTAVFQGEHGRTYGFEVAVYDRAGNRELFANQPESETVVDTTVMDQTPPTIQHSQLQTVEQGQDVTIQAQIIDESEIGEALLFYSEGGQSTFQSMQMAGTSATTFEATIVASQVPLAGFKYYIMASDASDNISYHPTTYETQPYSVRIRISGNNQQGLVRSEPQPSGTSASAYRMISVPLTLQNSEAAAVLEDDLGTYDGVSWRFFQYDPPTEMYNEFPEIDPFAPGKAFWLIVSGGNIRLDSGIGTSAPPDQAFEITLQEGWNDIANPFLFAVNWNDVTVTSGDPNAIMGPYTFQNDWLLPDQVTTLQPWEGYSIFSQSGGITIAIPPQAATAGQAVPLSQASNQDWTIQISAQTDDVIDEHNYLGVSADASNTWDSNDYLEPPRIAETVSLYFPHSDWQGFRGAFATDIRPEFRDGQTWDIEVKTQSAQEVTLKFDNTASLPTELNAVLVDPTANRQTDLNRTTTYTYTPQQPGSSRAFKLMVGTQTYIEDSEDLGAITPESFSLSQNYPNPFNAGTRIAYEVPEVSEVNIHVYNMVGEVVRELVSGEHQPGMYHAYWDGKSDRGAVLGSGVYLIRLHAGAVQKARKVVLIK